MRQLDEKWTPAQRDAIRARGETLLVFAAAGSGKTAVELGLDIADAAHFSEDGSQAGATQLVMVLYQEGKMQTVAMKQEDFSLKFDENGITQVQVSASCVGSADSVKVFLLDGNGSMVPLSEQVTQELAESHV